MASWLIVRAYNIVVDVMEKGDLRTICLFLYYFVGIDQEFVRGIKGFPRPESTGEASS